LDFAVLKSLQIKVGFWEFVIGILCVLFAVLVLGGDKTLVGFLFVLPMFFLLFAFPYVVVRRLVMLWAWLCGSRSPNESGQSTSQEKK